MLVAQIVALVVALTTLYQTLKNQKATQDVHQAVNGRMDALLSETERRARLEAQSQASKSQTADQSPPKV